MNTMAHRARRSSADTVARQAEREIFGEEPTSIYHDSAKDSRRLHLMRCLAWYSRFMETDDFKEETLEWCKDKRILHIEKMWDKVCLTYPALLRMTYRGFVLTHQEQQKVERYFQELSDRYGVISPSFTSSNHNFAPKMIISSTVSVNVTDKADIILSELIELEEKIGKKNLVIASSWNIKNTIIEHKISRGGLNTIITFANKRVSEYSGVLLGTSVDLVEGYSTFSKTTLRNLNQFWNRVLWSISSIQESYKQNRKPRKSATKTATIISSKSSTVPISFVFKATDAEFSVTSIKPENIIGAKWVVIFNTKYRKLTILQSATDTEFRIVGTTIRNVDIEKSSCNIVRIPETILPKITGMRTLGTIREVIAKEIRTKPAAITGRCGEDSIILNAGRIL